MDIGIDRIVITKKQYSNWINRICYLSFDYGVVTFDEACEWVGLSFKGHYDNEEDYNDALYDANRQLYDAGFYDSDDAYSFEAEQICEWDSVPVGENYVVIRAYGNF